jgi:hypothetical protein
MRASWVLLLLVALAPPAAGAQDLPEGVSFLVEAGDEYALALPQGLAWLQLAARDEGLHVALQAPGSNVSGEHVMAPNAHQGLPLDGATSASLRVLGGHGALMLARADLDGGGAPVARTAQGSLAPGQCRAHAATIPWGQAGASPRYDAQVLADGSGVSFHRWTAWLGALQGGKSHLAAHVYTDGEPVVLVQACHQGAEGTLPYTVRLSPVPGETLPGPAEEALSTVAWVVYALSGYGFLVAILAAGFLVGIAVARRPRGSQP